MPLLLMLNPVEQHIIMKLHEQHSAVLGGDAKKLEIMWKICLRTDRIKLLRVYWIQKANNYPEI